MIVPTGITAAALAARASYRRMMRVEAQTITLRRYTTVDQARSSLDAENISARVFDYEPAQLVGPIVQGDRRVILLAEDVEAAQWTPRRGDKIVLYGKELNIEFVDDSTRRVGDVLIAYELRVRG